jgi:hypothetical protein
MLWRLLLGMGALALLGMPARPLALLQPARHDSVTLDNYRCIQVGMTRAQVEAILGGPPGNYCRPGQPLRGLKPRALADPEIRQWIGSSLIVSVIFDGKGRVSGKMFAGGGPCLPMAEPDPSLLDRLRRLLPW